VRAFEGGAEIVLWRARVGDWAARRTAWSLGFTFSPRSHLVGGAEDDANEEWIGWLGRRDSREPRSRWLEPVVLERGGVRLRPWRVGDGVRLVETATDTVFERMLPHAPLPRSTEEVPGYLERLRLMESTDTRVAWCVADRETDLGLGNVALFEFDSDEPDGTAQVGYWSHPEGRGRGLMSAAVDLACTWAMSSQAEGGLGLRRLFLLTAVSNGPSQRLAERAGFARVGTERASAATADGGWEDNALYDRLRD
jgi:RimJ/RimL family protein N-acetyltransferase